MKMSINVISKTEEAISQAVHDQDVALLEKETLFVMQNYLYTMSEKFADILYGLTPFRVKLNEQPQFIFHEDYVQKLRSILTLTSRIYDEPINYFDAKMPFDQWFYGVTTEGILDTIYKPDYLVPITDAANELNISRSMIYKYISSGLEVVGEKGSQKVPRYVIEAWKDPAKALQIQWIHQVRKARTQTPEDKLALINEEIADFEIKYGGSFYKLYGHLSEEVDGMAEAVDLSDWKDLEEEKQFLLERMKAH
jgi:hypothetical protein